MSDRNRLFELGRPMRVGLAILIAFTACASVNPLAMGNINTVGIQGTGLDVSLEVRSILQGGTRLSGAEKYLTGFTPSVEDIEQAVQTAISISGLFRNVDTQSSLELTLILQRASLMSDQDNLARKVQVVIDWSLTDRSRAGGSLWAERIVTSDLKKFGDVLGGDARTASAVEGAVRKNIERAFRSIQSANVLSDREGNRI